MTTRSKTWIYIYERERKISSLIVLGVDARCPTGLKDTNHSTLCKINETSLTYFFPHLS